jgi:hypothetical protein
VVPLATIHLLERFTDMQPLSAGRAREPHELAVEIDDGIAAQRHNR